MKYRAFCMNHEPRRLPFTRAEIDALMQQADMCIAAPNGVRIGTNIDVGGKRMRCVGHEHEGKIVVLVEVFQ